jgi:hypothetical protein
MERGGGTRRLVRGGDRHWFKKHAARVADALSSAACDAADPVAPGRFSGDLPTIDHVMVTAGRPYYGRLADMDLAKIRDHIGAHLLQALYVARNAPHKVRPGGTLIFMGGTGGQRPAIGMGITSAVTAAPPALTANLALEIAPVRVTSSPRDSWTRLCPRNCWAISNNLNERALGFGLGSIGTRVLEKAFENPVKGMEARNGAAREARSSRAG